MIAGPLAAQRFYPTKDPAKTSLLIMVYWGTTHAPFPADESPEMANLQQAYENIFRDSGPYIIGSAGVGQEPGWSPISGARVPVSRMGEIAAAQELVAAANFRRENEDLVNIKMLGYDSWLERTRGDKQGTAFAQDRTDLYEEIEQSRYFVVLMAYDFQVLWKEKKHRLLWETRFSIRQQHHEFDKELPALADYASKYFGQDSHGLIHDRVPLGRVEVGDVKSLGEVSSPK